MGSIFPPTGQQDKDRFFSLAKEESEYMMFCLEFCDRILDERPEQADAIALAAGCFTALGYYADGLKADLKLAALTPRDPLVLYNLACSYSLNCRLDEAFETLRLAVENGYADHRHMEKDDDLAVVREDPRFAGVLEAIRKKIGGAGG